MKTKAGIQAACRLAYAEKRLFAQHPDETVRYNKNGHCCAIGAVYSPKDGLDAIVHRDGQYEIDRINAALPKHLQVEPDALDWAKKLQIAHDNWAAADFDDSKTDPAERERLFLAALNA